MLVYGRVHKQLDLSFYDLTRMGPWQSPLATVIYSWSCVEGRAGDIQGDLAIFGGYEALPGCAAAPMSF